MPAGETRVDNWRHTQVHRKRLNGWLLCSWDGIWRRNDKNIESDRVVNFCILAGASRIHSALHFCCHHCVRHVRFSRVRQKPSNETWKLAANARKRSPPWCNDGFCTKPSHRMHNPTCKKKLKTAQNQTILMPKNKIHSVPTSPWRSSFKISPSRIVEATINQHLRAFCNNEWCMVDCCFVGRRFEDENRKW